MCPPAFQTRFIVLLLLDSTMVSEYEKQREINVEKVCENAYHLIEADATAL